MPKMLNTAILKTSNGGILHVEFWDDGSVVFNTGHMPRISPYDDPEYLERFEVIEFWNTFNKMAAKVPTKKSGLTSIKCPACGHEHTISSPESPKVWEG